MQRFSIEVEVEAKIIYDFRYDGSFSEDKVKEVLQSRFNNNLWNALDDNFIQDIDSEIVETILTDNRYGLKKIRLHWQADGDTWEDILVSNEANDTDIKEAIQRALEHGEDDVNQFISIMQEKGFKTKIFREVIEIYDFNTGAQEEEERWEGCNKKVPLSEMSDVMEMYICNECEGEVK